MINRKNKKAFSMITAIFVIVIMATVSSLIMNVTGKTIKATTLQYQKEQAQLLARSYTELAILKVLYYDRNSSCLNTFSDTFGKEVGYDGYDVKVNIKYIGNNTLLANCGASPITSTWIDDNLTRFNQTISLIIDTFITYKDFDDPSNRDITFHRRTLQKI
jgi:type II secretory pathway pseudopilin PulG